MFSKFNKIKKSELITVFLVILLCVFLIFIPNKFSRQDNKLSLQEKSVVLSVNNDQIIHSGIISTGTQMVEIKILTGKYKNSVYMASNELMGRMEFDKIFLVGDEALAVLILNNSGDVISTNVIDHYRLNIESWLLIVFLVFLILFAGWVGFKAIITFLFTGLAIWKLLLPGFLLGYSPILLSLFIVFLLTFVIIFLVAGVNKRGVVAFSGAVSGILITCLMSLFFGDLFNIHGAIKPFSETLVYSGFSHLNLTEIFLAGIFLSSSGAVMDVAMDISVSQYEILLNNPSISRSQLIKSGFNIGRAIVGTMTTTLLLAYSGGFSALLMVFIAQGTPVVNMLNINYVAGEILHTLVGSFGLVLVAPLTAIIGGAFYVKKKN